MPRNPQRINPMLERIRALWHANPDFRLMQLLQVVISRGGDHFYLEDDVLDRRLRERMRDWEVQLELPTEEEEASS